MISTVRFFSRSGRTEKIAQAIAEGAGAAAVSITERREPDPCDLLFLGGAPYANVMAPELRAYVEKITPEAVKTVVLFTTSNWSRRTLRGMEQILRASGVSVAGETFYANAFQIEKRLADAKAFAAGVARKYALAPQVDRDA